LVGKKIRLGLIEFTADGLQGNGEVRRVPLVVFTL